MWIRTWISVNLQGVVWKCLEAIYTAIHPEHLRQLWAVLRAAMWERCNIVSGQQWTEKTNSDFGAQPQIRSPQAGHKPARQWPRSPERASQLCRYRLYRPQWRMTSLWPLSSPRECKQRSAQELTFVEQLFCARPAGKLCSFFTAAIEVCLTYNKNQTRYWLEGSLTTWVSSVQLKAPNV